MVSCIMPTRPSGSRNERWFQAAKRSIEGQVDEIVVVERKSGSHYGSYDAALRMARGEFVAVLDDDDLAFQGRIDAQVAALESLGVGWVCSAARVLLPLGLPFGTWGFALDPEAATEAIQRRNFAVHSTVTMVRDWALEAGGYAGLGPPPGGDWRFLKRLAAARGCASLGAVLGAHRINPRGVTWGGKGAPAMVAAVLKTAAASLAPSSTRRRWWLERL